MILEIVFISFCSLIRILIFHVTGFNPRYYLYIFGCSMGCVTPIPGITRQFCFLGEGSDMEVNMNPFREIEKSPRHWPFLTLGALLFEGNWLSKEHPMREPLDSSEGWDHPPTLGLLASKTLRMVVLQKGDCFSADMIGRGAGRQEHPILLRRGTEAIRGLHIPTVRPI